MTLKEYLKTHKHKGYKKRPIYYQDGNYVTYFTKQDRCYGKQIDDNLILYMSVDNDECVGYKLLNIVGNLNES